MIQVNQKQWSKLTQAEKTLAKTLGIAPKEPAVTKKESIPKPKPYIMRAKIYCYLCNSSTEQFFHMALKESQHYIPHLQSVEVTKVWAYEPGRKMSYQTKLIEMSTCPVCPEVLIKWEKKELVKKLINTYSLARAAMITGRRSIGENNS